MSQVVTRSQKSFPFRKLYKDLSSMFRYFPEKVDNENSFSRFLKQLTYFTISTVCFSRKLFEHEGNFNARWHSKTPINLVNPNAGDPSVRKLVHSLITASTLIDSKKLVKLIFGLVKDEEKEDEFVEIYCLEYKYPETYDHLVDLPQKCLELMTSIEEATFTVDPDEDQVNYFVVKIFFKADNEMELDGYHKSPKRVSVPNCVISTKLGSICDIFSISISKSM